MVLEIAPIASPNPAPPPAPIQGLLICRVLVNHDQKCVAMSRAYYPKPLPGKKQVTYMEYSVTAHARDWSYTTSTGAGVSEAQLMQLPRALTSRLIPKGCNPKAVGGSTHLFDFDAQRFSWSADARGRFHVGRATLACSNCGRRARKNRTATLVRVAPVAAFAPFSFLAARTTKSVYWHGEWNAGHWLGELRGKLL